MSDIWNLYDRETNELVDTFDVTSRSDRDKERIFSGMVYKIDFERFWLDRGNDD